MSWRRVVSGGLLAAACLLFFSAGSASAKEEVIKAVKYADTTTYSCRTDAITINPGQNLNDFAPTRTCPNAEKISGPGSTDVFAPGSTAEGYITRFKPSMVCLLYTSPSPRDRS